MANYLEAAQAEDEKIGDAYRRSTES
jgi:hypothetical protein